MQRFQFVGIVWLMLVLCGCDSATAAPTLVPTPHETATVAGCAQTPYVAGRPPDPNTAMLTDTWFANEWLWAGLVPPFRGVWYAGGIKVGWWRSVSGKLTIEGRRLDAPAPPPVFDVPDGYGLSGFQATGINFPTDGCWEVIGHASDMTLRFVVQVHAASENPVRSNGTPIPTPTVRVGVLDCTRDQLGRLVDDFFAIYNQHDIVRLLSLFNFTSEFQYDDDLNGEKREIRERADLEQYLQSRFALNDQFLVVKVDLPVQAIVPFCATNPTIAFQRSDSKGRYTGNAKLVVSGGKLKGIVTSSTRTTSPMTTTTPIALPDLKAPTAAPGYFWANDEPKELPALTFGVLPYDEQPNRGVTVGAPVLAASFPAFPGAIDVYLVGEYPASQCTLLSKLVNGLEGWDCVPFYSLVQYRGGTPLGEKIDTPSAAQVEQRSAMLLRERGLLMADQSRATVQQTDDGSWRVSFFQRINGIPVYANKALAVTLNRDGQATHIIGRRRPLLARASYPLRTAEDAWQQLREGRARSFYVDDLSPARPAAIDRFTQIELAYAEVEVIAAEQLMQPYFVFRAESGQSLYVPAVADPYVRSR